MLSVQITDTPFSPSTLAVNIENLKLTIDNKSYDHLRHYVMIIKNVGVTSINGLKLIFKASQNVKIIKDTIESDPLLIKPTREDIMTDHSFESHYSIARLEKNDKLKFSLLLNAHADEQLDYLIRDVDDLDIISGINELPVTNEIVLTHSYKTVVGLVTMLDMISIIGLLVIPMLSPTPNQASIATTNFFKDAAQVLTSFLVGTVTSKVL